MQLFKFTFCYKEIIVSHKYIRRCYRLIIPNALTERVSLILWPIRIYWQQVEYSRQWMLHWHRHMLLWSYTLCIAPCSAVPAHIYRTRTWSSLCHQQGQLTIKLNIFCLQFIWLSNTSNTSYSSIQQISRFAILFICTYEKNNYCLCSLNLNLNHIVLGWLRCNLPHTVALHNKTILVRNKPRNQAPHSCNAALMPSVIFNMQWHFLLLHQIGHAT